MRISDWSSDVCSSDLQFSRSFTVSVERTLSILKPDVIAKNVVGQVVARIESAGLKVIASRMTHLTQTEAEGFYAVHRERPFFGDLVKFMISGPEIGSASCRERVCKYVSISVVAVSLKKKTQTNKIQ